MSLIDRMLSRKLLILTGKGGIGKSLVSAAIAQFAAETGRRTLLVERSALGQLSPLFGQESLGHQETQLADNLWTINIDAHRCFEEYIVKRLGQAKLYEKVFSHNVVRTFLHTIPGLGEVMVLGRIYYTCVVESPSKYDLVVFDAPASGHFYSLMTTPDAIIGAGLGGPLVAEVKRVRDFLADRSQVGAAYVAIPEELVISECLEFVPKLVNDCPVELLGVIVNRSYSEKKAEALPALRDLAIHKLQLTEIARYLIERMERSIANQSTLIGNLARMKSERFSGESLLLPELGVISEPLPVGFGREFFGGGFDS